MTESYAEKKQDYRHGRREKFLDLAAEILAIQGIRQTTMDQIADHVGVKKMVLYRYFGAKDKLVHALLERICEAILDADAKSNDWWTERVRNTMGVAKTHRNSLILLIRHCAHDPEFGTHLDALQNELSERTEVRLREIFEDKSPRLSGSKFLSQSINSFFFNSYLRWLENDMEDNDDEFFEWITKSVRAMSYYWYDGLPPGQ